MFRQVNARTQDWLNMSVSCCDPVADPKHKNWRKMFGSTRVPGAATDRITPQCRNYCHLMSIPFARQLEHEAQIGSSNGLRRLSVHIRSLADHHCVCLIFPKKHQHCPTSINFINPTCWGNKFTQMLGNPGNPPKSRMHPVPPQREPQLSSNSFT